MKLKLKAGGCHFVNCYLCCSIFIFLGDICQQFAKEMFEMYQNYADYKRWTFDIVNYTPAEIGTAVLQMLH